MEGLCAGAGDEGELEETSPADGHPELRLPASITVRKRISPVQAIKFMVLFYGALVN